MLHIEWVLCLVLSSLSAALLLVMMRRRQLKLIGLLRSHIEEATQFDRRRARAAALTAAELAKPREP